MNTQLVVVTIARGLDQDLTSQLLHCHCVQNTLELGSEFALAHAAILEKLPKPPSA
jgi:hypothetical protein